jgi:hypothetical protein
VIKLLYMDIVFLFLALLSTLLFFGKLSTYSHTPTKMPDIAGIILFSTTIALWIGFYIFITYHPK